MHILLAGGTGFIGSPLRRRLVRDGHTLLALTRHPAGRPDEPGVRWLAWDGGWERAMADVDAVVNFTGEPLVGRRWTPSQKQRLQDSRVATTQRLVRAMAEASRRPAVLVNASAIGYYGPRGDEVLTESDVGGRGTLADLCRAWEAEAQQAEAAGVRVVRLRLGVVLGPGGALAKMAPPFRLWLGGPLGSGVQWVSWIHLDDALGLILWALARRDIAGALNATAPQPVTMREFCRTLGRVLHRPSWLPAPAPALRLLLGEAADVLLTGQRVIPHVAMNQGYTFVFPELTGALRACFGRSSALTPSVSAS